MFLISGRTGNALMAVAAAVLLVGQARAELVFDPPAIDLGEIKSGQTAEIKFSLNNHGRDRAEDVQIKAGCGCLRPKLGAAAIEPGKQANGKAAVNSLNASAGRHVWEIRASYRQRDVMKEAVLTVKATIFQEVIVQPPSLTVSSDGPTRHELKVTDSRKRPLRLTKVETTSAHVKAALDETNKDRDGKPVWKVRIEIAETLPVGRAEHVVTIRTDDPAYPALNIYIDATRRTKQRVNALPGTVKLVVSASKPNASRLVTLQDPEKEPIVIEKVEADESAIQCRFAEGSHAVGSVKIAVDGSKMTGDALRGRVRVYIRSPAAEVLEIPVTVEVK